MKQCAFLLVFLGALAPAVAEAACAFVSNGGVARGTSSATPTAPAGVSLNDTIVILATVRTDNAGGTLNIPAGFSQAVCTGSTLAGGSYNNACLFYKTAVAADVTLSSGAGTYTVSYNTGGTIDDVTAHVRDYSGTATTSQINGTAAVLGGNTTFTVIPAVLETFISGECYVAYESDETAPAGSPSSSPALSNTYYNSGFLNSAYSGDLIPSAAPGAETITNAGPVVGRPALGVTIKPLGGVAPPSGHLLPLMGVGN